MDEQTEFGPDHRQTRRLSIPIYLNQRIVFDLLAIVQEGFAELRTIKTSESGTEMSKGSVGGEVGVSNVFAFLGISLKGGREKAQSSETQREISEERVFTPSSLFSTLRDVLIERDLVIDLDLASDFDGVSSGSFVEFTALLRKNPLIEAFEGMIQLMKTADLFAQRNEPNTDQKRSGRVPNRANTQAASKTSSSAMIAQLQAFLDSVSQANTIDLLADLQHDDMKAVVPVEVEYFSSKTPVAIADGEFSVLGKVVRVVPTDTEDAINLLRGTSIGLVQRPILVQLRAGFSSLRTQGFDLPEVVTHINGPVIQIVPIAIYA